jgi:hypothetical protein
MGNEEPGRLPGRLLWQLLAALLIATLSTLAFAPDQSKAAGGQALFTLAPARYKPGDAASRPYLILQTAPGASLTEAFRVTNIGTASGTARLYPVDATTGQTGGVVYLQQANPRRDVGAWIGLDVQTVVLAPGESRLLTIHLQVPANARGGDHVGGIVAEDARRNTGVESTQIHISVIRRTIMAVQLKLGGPLRAQLAATDVSVGGANRYQAVLLGLANEGTVLLTPQGRLQVFDAFGQQRMDASFKLDTFLPQTAIHYPVYVQKRALEAGTYNAMVALTYGQNQTISYRASFAVTPQQLQQIFGSPALQAPGSGISARTPSLFWYVVAALVLLLGGSQGIFFWRGSSSTRAEKRKRGSG